MNTEAGIPMDEASYLAVVVQILKLLVADWVDT
jgi:hypothetical protein